MLEAIVVIRVGDAGFLCLGGDGGLRLAGEVADEVRLGISMDLGDLEEEDQGVVHRSL